MISVLRFKYLAIIIAIVVLTPALVFPESSIKWMTFHWKPAMSLDNKGNVTGGVSGEQLLALTADLSDYEHSYISMNWRRFWDVIKKKNDNICNCLAIKTEERESLALFSEPFSIALAVSVIMRKDAAKKLGMPESVSLVSLMKDSRFTGNLIEGRSYSQKIDNLLSVHEKNSNIARQVMSGENSVLMLIYNRIDYILDYPALLDTRLSGQAPEQVDTLVSIPIREINPYYLVYVACTKNEWGEKKIKRINRSIKNLHKKDDFKATFAAAYSGETLKRIESLYDQYFIQGKGADTKISSD